MAAVREHNASNANRICFMLFTLRLSFNETKVRHSREMTKETDRFRGFQGNKLSMPGRKEGRMSGKASPQNGRSGIGHGQEQRNHGGGEEKEAERIHACVQATKSDRRKSVERAKKERKTDADGVNDIMPWERLPQNSETICLKIAKRITSK